MSKLNLEEREREKKKETKSLPKHNCLIILVAIVIKIWTPGTWIPLLRMVHHRHLADFLKYL